MKAIISRETSAFPSFRKDCDEYMNIVYQIGKGEMLTCSNHVFSVEFVRDEG